jgi:hypothetical protein
MTLSRIAYLCLVSLLLVGGCSKAIEHDEILGHYQLSTPQFRDTLELYDDGSYIHSFTSPTGDVTIDRGRWEFTRESGRLALVFHGFTHRARAYYAPSAPREAGMWPVVIEKTWRGQIRLEVDRDIDLFYVRSQ